MRLTQAMESGWLAWDAANDSKSGSGLHIDYRYEIIAAQAAFPQAFTKQERILQEALSNKLVSGLNISRYPALTVRVCSQSIHQL